VCSHFTCFPREGTDKLENPKNYTQPYTPYTGGNLAYTAHSHNVVFSTTD